MRRDETRRVESIYFKFLSRERGENLLFGMSVPVLGYLSLYGTGPGRMYFSKSEWAGFN